MSEKERLQLENELLMTCSKAQAINKYIDELEESSKLSELWCKSQQENQQLKQKYLNAVADYESEKSKNQMAIKIIEDNYYSKNTTDIDSIVVSSNKFIQVRKILKGDNNE